MRGCLKVECPLSILFYTYDGLHRLQTADQGTLSSGSITSSNQQRYWELDQLGNWSKLRNGLTDTSTVLEDRAHNEVNELTGFTSPTNYVDPVHDAAGNMTYAPDPSSPEEGFKFSYDAWNRLVYVENDADKFVASYHYDGLHQRIQRKVSTAPSTTDIYDYYYNDQWQLLTEVKNSTVEAVYHWHPFYVDALAVRMRTGDTHFFLQDANFNVTAAVDDNGNAVVERYSYTPYGEVTYLNDDFSVKSTQASAIGNTHLYTGRERDSETGLQLNRNRYYASHLGRWINRDPAEFIDGLNLYQYVNSRAIISSDPFGLITREDCEDACKTAFLLCMAGGLLICGEICAWPLFKCATAPYPINLYYCAVAAKCMYDCLQSAAAACGLAYTACLAACQACKPEDEPTPVPEPPPPPVA